jgi:hypothetical protein
MNPTPQRSRADVANLASKAAWEAEEKGGDHTKTASLHSKAASAQQEAGNSFLAKAHSDFAAKHRDFQLRQEPYALVRYTVRKGVFREEKVVSETIGRFRTRVEADAAKKNTRGNTAIMEYFGPLTGWLWP